MKDPIIEDMSGAINQDFFLRVSNIFISIFCAIKKATPDPNAIRIDIMSLKLVETNKVKITPMKNPI